MLNGKFFVIAIFYLLNLPNSNAENIRNNEWDVVTQKPNSSWHFVQVHTYHGLFLAATTIVVGVLSWNWSKTTAPPKTWNKISDFKFICIVLHFITLFKNCGFCIFKYNLVWIVLMNVCLLQFLFIAINSI